MVTLDNYVMFAEQISVLEQNRVISPLKLKEYLPDGRI